LGLPERVRRKLAQSHCSDIVWARLGSLGRDPLGASGLGELG